MNFIKRLLLCVATGSVSLILAGCYGVMMPLRDSGLDSPAPPDTGVAEPIPDLEVTRVPESQ